MHFHRTGISDYPVWVARWYAYKDTNLECWGCFLPQHCHVKCHTSGGTPVAVWPQGGWRFICTRHECSGTRLGHFDNPSLMDCGTNICITGLLGLLVDVVSIPPLPISVATAVGSFSLDDCCTKRGLIPLTLSDGSVYYQPYYYCNCKNATEIIISPEAILAASNTLVHWTQEGHKGDAPGSIWFTSDIGLYAGGNRAQMMGGLLIALQWRFDCCCHCCCCWAAWDSSGWHLAFMLMCWMCAKALLVWQQINWRARWKSRENRNSLEDMVQTRK